MVCTHWKLENQGIACPRHFSQALRKGAGLLLRPLVRGNPMVFHLLPKYSHWWPRARPRFLTPLSEPVCGGTCSPKCHASRAIFWILLLFSMFCLRPFWFDFPFWKLNFLTKSAKITSSYEKQMHFFEKLDLPFWNYTTEKTTRFGTPKIKGKYR